MKGDYKVGNYLIEELQWDLKDSAEVCQAIKALEGERLDKSLDPEVKTVIRDKEQALERVSELDGEIQSLDCKAQRIVESTKESLLRINKLLTCKETIDLTMKPYEDTENRPQSVNRRVSAIGNDVEAVQNCTTIPKLNVGSSIRSKSYKTTRQKAVGNNKKLILEEPVVVSDSD